MLLTASSRPIRMLSLPLRSNSWLSASTIRRAGAGAALTSAGVVTAAAAGAEADAPLSMLPQFEQKASPAGLTAPQLGQTCVPALCASAGWGLASAVAVAAGAAAASGSPHSSQKAEPSGFS